MELFSEYQIADKLDYNRSKIAKWRKEGKITPIAIKGDKMKMYFYDYDQVKHLARTPGEKSE